MVHPLRRIRQSRTCHLHFILSLANSWHFGTTDGCIKLPSFAIGFDLRWHLKCQSQYRSLHFKCQEFARVRGMSFQLHFGTWHCQEMLRSPGKHNWRIPRRHIRRFRSGQRARRVPPTHPRDATLGERGSVAADSNLQVQT